MKTENSIPAPLFEEVHRLADRLGMSLRSRISYLVVRISLEAGLVAIQIASIDE
jgi:hypothetical protein